MGTYTLAFSHINSTQDLCSLQTFQRKITLTANRTLHSLLHATETTTYLPKSETKSCFTKVLFYLKTCNSQSPL